MGIVLGPNQYGKAEIRVLRVVRDTPRHEIRDLCVSTALRGEFAAAHVTGDQASVLPTDSQKNTCFAYAKEHWTGEIEEYGLALADRIGTIECIEQDLEGRVYLAVTVEDDPGKDLGELRQPGHRFFFLPDEVEAIS